MSNNRAAVHLGKLSALSRKKKLGGKAFKQSMKELRKKGKQKAPFQEAATEVSK